MAVAQLVGDYRHAGGQLGGAGDVVGVVVTVDDESNRLRGDPGDLFLVYAGRLDRYRVEGDHALAGDDEHRVVRLVTEHVHAVVDADRLVLSLPGVSRRRDGNRAERYGQKQRDGQVQPFHRSLPETNSPCRVSVLLEYRRKTRLDSRAGNSGESRSHSP